MSITAPTHHITAQPGEFAKSVIMAGDPLRAKMIAETYLDNVRQINSVRCMYAYTGTFGGKAVSVMAHGIGAPSIGVHAWELFHLYGVENILRVGTAASMQPHLAIGDVVVAMGACYNTPYADQYQLQGHFSAIASYPLLQAAVEQGQHQGIPLQVGNVLSSDVFYPETEAYQENWRKMGVLCVEMEVAALYIVAARAGKNALGLLTMSDHVLTGEKVSAQVRQNNFTQMIQIALNIAP